MTLPTVIWYICFCYFPMFGILMAFKNFKIVDATKNFFYNLLQSEWNGMDNFKFLFTSGSGALVVKLTLLYNIVFIILGVVAPNAADQWDKVEEWNETAESSVLLGFNFDRTNVETQIANCSLVMDRYKKELYTGTRDPQEAVPALYADLEKAGLEDIRAEYQAQVDAFLASK